MLRGNFIKYLHLNRDLALRKMRIKIYCAHKRKKEENIQVYYKSFQNFLVNEIIFLFIILKLLSK